MEQARVSSLDAGPRGAIVGRTVDAVSTETAAPDTTDAIELRAGTDIEVSIARHGDGGDHRARKTGNAFPVVTLVPGAPQSPTHATGDELNFVDCQNATGPASKVVGSHRVPVVTATAVGGLHGRHLAGALSELTEALVVHFTRLDVGPQRKQHLLHSGGISNRGLNLGGTRSIVGRGGALHLEEGQGAGETGGGQKEDSLLHCGSVPVRRKAEFKQGTPPDRNRFDVPVHRRVQGA